MALRFKRIESEEEWKVMRPNIKAINKGYGKRKGRIMFPTSHDITEESFYYSEQVLEKLLKAGNEVLLTTKPKMKFLWGILGTCRKFKDQVQLRVTITSIDNELLTKYEPNAPNYWARVRVLKKFYLSGLKTSVSIEPFLDDNPLPLIRELAPYCTESIWLGVMSGSVPTELKRIYRAYNLKRIIYHLTDFPREIIEKVRFKDSIVNKVGLTSNKLLDSYTYKSMRTASDIKNCEHRLGKNQCEDEGKNGHN